MSRIITNLHPQLQSKITTLKEKCEKKGLKIGIGECVRTVEEQDALYAKGRTVPGSKVTNAKGSTYSSMHQWGIAFDFYRNDGKGAYCSDGNFFEKVGKIGVSIGLEWGENWTSIKDRPHFQLPQWGSTPSKLKSQYRTLDKFVKSWNAATKTDKPKVKLYTVTDMPNSSKYDAWVAKIQRATGSTEDGKYGKNTLSKCPGITYGDKGTVIELIKERLKNLGFFKGAVNKTYDPSLKEAVVAYEKCIGFDDKSGKMDKSGRTWSALIQGIK